MLDVNGLGTYSAWYPPASIEEEVKRKVAGVSKLKLFAGDVSQDYKNVLALYLDVKLLEPQPWPAAVDNRRPGHEIEFKAVPWATQNLAGTIRHQIVNLVRLRQTGETSVCQVGALMRTSRCDRFYCPRRQAGEQNRASAGLDRQ